MTFRLQNGTNVNVFWYVTRPYDHSSDSANARKEFLKLDLKDWTTKVSFISTYLSLISFQAFISQSHSFRVQLLLSISNHSYSIFTSNSLSHKHIQSHTDTHIEKHTHTHTYKQTEKHIHIQTHIQKNIHRHTETYSYT